VTTPAPIVSADPVIQWIVEQHADEAAFLWLMRDQLVDAPHVTLDDLARHDERLEAHLDGLRVAGDHGWEACKALIAPEEPGALFTAAVLAFGGERAEWMREVLDFARADAALARAASSALGWLPREPALRVAERLTRAEDPVWRRIGIAAFALHRCDPGVALGQALIADDPALLVRALRAAGELGRVDTLPLVRGHLDAEDRLVRLSAAWSAALLAGDADALGVLAEFVERPAAPAAEVSDSADAGDDREDDGAWSEWLAGGEADDDGAPPPETPEAPSDELARWRRRALELVARRLPPPAALRWVERLAMRGDLRREAIMAAGALGDPVLVPWLIDQMREPASARLAGEAFATITGADLKAQRLAIKPPDGQAGPNDDADDENVALDADEDLPWPDASCVLAWWVAGRHQLAAGKRHLLGRTLDDGWLSRVLRAGMQRQCAAAALELTIRRPGTALFNVRASAACRRGAHVG
jgi:hypothetical protein